MFQNLILRAAQEQKLKQLKLLMRIGVSLDSRDSNNRTALWLAVNQGLLPAVKTLLKAGVDPDILGWALYGRWVQLSPLMLAAQKGEVAIAKALLASGAKVDKQNDEGVTVLMVAAAARYYPYATLLCSPPKSESRKQTIELLLAHGADVNLEESRALYYAVKSGQPEHVRMLLAAGSDVPFGLQSGWREKYEITGLLLGHGAPWKLEEFVQDTREWSDRGRIFSIAASTAVTREHRSRLLLFAIRMGQYDIPKPLFAQGVDVNIRSDDGRTLLMLPDFIPRDTVEILLALGIDVNARDNNGNTALMLHPSEADLLISHGADVNARDNNGNTALMLHPERADLLISHGADVSAQNNEGWTALMFVTFRNRERTSYEERLLAAGADPSIKNRYGDTAEMLRGKGHWEPVSPKPYRPSGGTHVSGNLDWSDYTGGHYTPES